MNHDIILEALREHAPRSMHLAEVCVVIGVPKQERDHVRDTLMDLVSDGIVDEMPGNRFRLRKKARRPAHHSPHGPAPSGTVDGRLTMHPSGFGFVAAEDGGPDIFIPPPSVRGALHGDRVRVYARRSPKGREGEVADVLERGARIVGGVLRRAGGNTWIDPDDIRMRGPIPVIGEPPQLARTGYQVVAEIIEYPRFPDEVPEVRVIQVLGAPGITEVEVAKLKLREGVVEEFPDQVLDEATQVPEKVLPKERKEREDLRGLDLVTIDPSDARDHDDALFCERLEDGGFRVLIAIADVAHYVREGTAIDVEAFRRGNSIYLPDRAIPMLPPELSSHMASLVPKRDRLTMAVEVDLGPQGAIRHHRFIEGVMRSKARLTYEGVARALGLTDEGPVEREAEERIDMIRGLYDLSVILRRRRMRRGALDFDLPEGRVKLDPETEEPIDIVRSKKDPGVRKAYSLVEEMMLLANEVVGASLEKLGVPAVYRIHPKPAEHKIEAFVKLANALGFDLDLESATDPRLLSKFLKKVKKLPISDPLNTLLLRAMNQASYDVKNIGHFGLGASVYLHFTSPIRRYADLSVHRILKRVIHEQEIDKGQVTQKLRLVCSETSRLERKAMDLERDVVNLYRAVFMQDRVGDTFKATITGIAPHGMYVSFDEPFVDAKVPIERLDDAFEPDSLGIRLFGHHTGRMYELGDRIEVRLEEASIERRELVAIPISGAKLEEDANLPVVDTHEDREQRMAQKLEEDAQREMRRRRREDGGRRAPKRRQEEDGPRDESASPRRARKGGRDTNQDDRRKQKEGRRADRKAKGKGPSKPKAGGKGKSAPKGRKKR